MPSNSRSKIQIFNAALTATRNNTVTTNDGSKEWLLLESNWTGIVEAALERGRYNFSRERVDLTSRNDGAFGYDDRYTLPADCLIVRHVYVDEVLTEDWETDADELFINATSGVEAEYVQIADVEQTWSRQFDLGIQLKMEAVCLRGLNEEYAEADRREERADYELLRARSISSGQRGKRRPYREGRVMRARHGSA